LFVGVFQIGDFHLKAVDGQEWFIRDSTEEMRVVSEQEFEILFVFRVYGDDDAACAF
jgi:hypothetical protein